MAMAKKKVLRLHMAKAFILFYLVFVSMLLVTHCFYAPLFFFFVVFCLLISRIIVLFSLLFAS